MTEIRRPCWPWSSNRTLPSTFANSVWFFAKPDVESRLETATLLAHQDRPARDEVAVVPLHAEPLRVAVAAVA
jgi:hypothetical protein